MKEERKNKGNVPNLRFPEFEGEWEVKKLGEILKVGSGRDYKHLKEGNIPVFGTGGYMTSVNEFLFDGESVCIGRKGTINKPFYYNGKFWTVDTLFYTYSYKNVLPKFVFNVFEQINWLMYNEASGVPSLSKSTIEQIEISIPDISEQQKIASFLSLIDERIAAQSKIIEGLKELKAWLSKQLFSRKLRFKDDDGADFPEWKTQLLGNVTMVVSERNKNNEKLPVYSINNKDGFVPQNEQFEGIDSDDRGYDIKLYKVINKHTFAYNPARINVGSIGYSGNLENIIISSLYVCFKTQDSINDNFLFHFFKTNSFNKEVLKNVEGGVRDYLFYENFSKIRFEQPCMEEQGKITDFLSSYDYKIRIESKVLQQLEIQKKYLLKQMFI
ncbi:restriction endonuclease subunit S [uncultured Dysgonomonas sp.]|nr:restriction endonuclease subunit S [uncultured Dysgonomonas sp.]